MPDSGDPQDLRSALGRTIPASGFVGAHVPPAPAIPAAGKPEAQSFTLAGASLTLRLQQHGRPMRVPIGERFENLQIIGDGANGRVTAVRDNNLDREVAVKFLKSSDPPDQDDVESFISEARTTASLEHPNVLPVHDIDVNDRGQIYFSMKRITGRSLGEAIELSSAAARTTWIDSPMRVATILIAVAHALTYAHHRGIVHQDVKPDNIMLGDFGEVLLVDWGSAARLADPHPRLYGTPLYMSPEQARLERVDERSDVYSVGATLFHTLTLRVPTWSTDPDEFWRKKRAGVIDPLSEQESRAYPPALLAIALKAMSADPAARYARMEDVAKDLEAWLAGHAVTARRDPWWERLSRWHRRNARLLWTVAGAAGIIVVLALALYGERLKDIATWGDPIVVERFSDPAWTDRWKTAAGAWEVRGDRIVSTYSQASMLELLREVRGDVAIEYDGEILADSYPCDLSLMLTDAIAPKQDRALSMTDRPHLTFQIGANEGSYCRILDRQERQVAFSYFRPETGVRYRIRVEVLDGRLRLLVDGRVVCEYHDLFPFTSGTIALYGFYPGKAFGNVRVFARGTPVRLRGTAVGDFNARNGEWRAAAEEYERVGADHSGTDIADEALYKRGYALLHTEHPEEAESAWSGIRSDHWRGLANLHRCDHLIETGHDDEAMTALRAILSHADGDVRSTVAARWGLYARAAADRADHDGSIPVVERWLALRRESLADEPVTDLSAANCLLTLGQFDAVLAEYPRLPIETTLALERQGHPEVAFAREAHRPTLGIRLLGEMGRGDEILGIYPQIGVGAGYFVSRYDWHQVIANESEMLLTAGRFDELLTRTTTDRFRDMCLLQLGRADEIPVAQRGVEWLMATGDIDEALRQYGEDAFWGMWPRDARALQAAIRGDGDEARRLLTIPDAWRFRQAIWLVPERYAIAPFILESLGDRSAVRASYEEAHHHPFAYRQYPWLIARRIAGEVDDAPFLALPADMHAQATLVLVKAIVAERIGDPAAATAAYCEYQRLPMWKRVRVPNPVLDGFVAWRLQQLAAATGRDQPQPHDQTP